MPSLVRRLLLLGALFLVFSPVRAGLELATFDCDVTPATGSWLCYDPMIGVGELSLRCRGVVLTGSGKPIVLCAVDWIGIANEAHDAFRDQIAAAAGTTRDRVALHVLHQHDAPVADFTAARILTSRGLSPGVFDPAIVLPAMSRASNAVRIAMTNRQPVSHIGWGRSEVGQVASNRRIPGPDGRIRGVRYTACTDPALRAAPEGTVDPRVIMLSFWNGDRPLVAISYYATHPQSYYRTGLANPDFPGIARFTLDQLHPGLLHVHFNGAGGNIGAGKYNDGAVTNRAVLARRLAEGMERAWSATVRQSLDESAVTWSVEQVHLPVASHLNRERDEATLKTRPAAVYVPAAKLAWLERDASGHLADVACLQLGDVRLLHLPGELFVEYQLAAQQMRPDLKVAMAAYGDYGSSYIGTERSYAEGGYETQPDSSFVDPSVQQVLLGAIGRLLGAGGTH